MLLKLAGFFSVPCLEFFIWLFHLCAFFRLDDKKNTGSLPSIMKQRDFGWAKLCDSASNIQFNATYLLCFFFRLLHQMKRDFRISLVLIFDLDLLVPCVNDAEKVNVWRVNEFSYGFPVGIRDLFRLAVNLWLLYRKFWWNWSRFFFIHLIYVCLCVACCCFFSKRKMWKIN